MISELNLLKPMGAAQAKLAKKCGWKNIDHLPKRGNILPEGFVGSAKLEPQTPVIGTKLTQNNITAMELILGNDKLSRSPFVRLNMTGILEMANTPEGSVLVQKILTPENVDKLDSIRALVKRHPNDYIKDKSVVKYIATPAGLNSLFNDISMLKAAHVLNKDALNALFKMDVTKGSGLKILESIGKYDIIELETAKKTIANQKFFSTPELQIAYFSK